MNDFYRIGSKLIKDKRNRYYLPEFLFCDVIDKDEILVNTPSIGVSTYKVHQNKDGSMWIKGNVILKYYDDFDIGTAPNRAFLSEKIIERIKDI